MKRKSYVVIGIDGADFCVIDKMIELGAMPNLSTILETATRDSIDTYGNCFGQGWATFMSGVPPEEHGICYWKISHGSDSSDFQIPLLWNTLEKAGKSSGVVNLSYTFPPAPMNGFIISGLGGGLSPNSSARYMYPDSLHEEIEKNAEGYIWGLERGEGNIEQHLEYIDKLVTMTRKRRTACMYLLEKKNVDFFTVVFRGADAIQHSFWKALEIENSAPAEMDVLKVPIIAYYKELDRAIKDLWEFAEPNNRMILSDHGFGPTTCIFKINEFLHETGFLYKKMSAKSLLGNKIFHSIKSKYGPFYRRYLLNYSWMQALNKRRAQIIPKIESAIDWEKTKIYANDAYGLRFNYKVCDTSRKRREVTMQVERQIKKMKNPFTGGLLFSALRSRKSYGLKRFEDIAPDIIFELADESCLVDPEITMEKQNIVFHSIEDNPLYFMSGSHRRLGILITDRGYLRRSNHIKMENIYPTILDSLKIPVPDYVNVPSLRNNEML